MNRRMKKKMVAKYAVVNDKMCSQYLWYVHTLKILDVKTGQLFSACIPKGNKIRHRTLAKEMAKNRDDDVVNVTIEPVKVIQRTESISEKSV